MGGEHQKFDFELLDDLLLLCPSEVRGSLAALRPMEFCGIGPIAEYALYRSSTTESYPRLSEISPSALADRLEERIEARGRFDLASTSLEPLPFEFSSLPDCSEVSRLLWRAFQHRLANAAQSAGFDGITAKGLAGAFGELHDNARDHCGARNSVLTGYRWSAGEFEMVVADGGMGVLGSLRSHPDYYGLADHGEALTTALSSGETRYGRGSGHGTGFDTVFRNIASLSGSLRFRSGDHTLEIEGVSPKLTNARLRQRQLFRGFAVSITCRQK